jgi:hypothetical protein
MRDSSTVGDGFAGGFVVVVAASPVWRRATQGRTTSSVRARFMGR